MRLLLFLVILCSYTTADNREFVAKTSDVLVVALPVVTFANTFGFDDGDGKKQLALSIATSQATTQLLKLLIDKERPNKSDMRSFPSGHSTTAFQSASFIHFRYGLKYSVPYYFVASYVVWARIHAKRHYIEDCAAGITIGVLSSWIFTSKFEESKVSFSPEFLRVEL